MGCRRTRTDKQTPGSHKHPLFSVSGTSEAPLSPKPHPPCLCAQWFRPSGHTVTMATANTWSVRLHALPGLSGYTLLPKMSHTPPCRTTVGSTMLLRTRLVSRLGLGDRTDHMPTVSPRRQQLCMKHHLRLTGHRGREKQVRRHRVEASSEIPNPEQLDTSHNITGLDFSRGCH